MNHLILIKHAMPQVDEQKSSADWQLSDRGRASCKPLADASRPYKPDLFITSEEPKARESGQLTAEYKSGNALRGCPNDN
jgi:phosphohistidine phosphatase SixA